MLRRHKILVILAIVILALAAAVFIFKRDAAAPDTAPAPTVGNRPEGQVKSQAATAPSPAAKPAFDKQQRSVSDPASIWVVANKRRPLDPATYTPQVAAPAMRLRLSASAPEMQVSTAAKADLERLDAAAKAAGVPLMLASGYRSYQTQTAVYASEVRAYGQAQADRQSARPGHSEHQTGLAIDLAPASGACMIEECFGSLPEGRWLAANAHAYGFIIRYPQGKEAVTGYLYEPWHLRYIGTDLAAELHRQGNPTLEEFFGLGAAPSY